MDLLRHHRSLTLLIFVLAAHFSLSTADHPHRHHHNGSRHRRQNHSPLYYYPENADQSEYGDWGPWTPAGECSRSCGGGVAYEIRECYSKSEDDSSNCRGSSRRYYSCNIHDCSDPYFDFRAHQCSMFDSVPFDSFYYTWIPYTKGSNKCELNCMPRNERFYYRHKKHVIDGTPCDDESRDICVNGKCSPVGCDRVLGSSAREDICRVCGGDGSSCNTIRGILDRNDLQVGYNDMLLIPANATNIRIREVQSSNNYLAIRNLSGHYYLNGNWRIDVPKKNRFIGTIFHYERLRLTSPESITALGPITEPIYIVILYQERNTGVEYEYSVPKAVVNTLSRGYQWTYDEFSNCSSTCGGGYKIRNVWCAQEQDGRPASNDLCDPALEPLRNQTCAQEPCPPQWIVGEWSECSHICGFNGTQNRTVHCEQIISNGKPTKVENYLCTANGEESPPTNQSCNVGLPCPKWFVGPWKACDKLCGNGFQRRDVRCYHKIDGRISVKKDSACPEAKPEFEKSCFLRPCEGVDWIISEWSGCSDQCDVTTETRRAVCSSIKGKVYPEKFCRKSKLPTLVRECKAPACEFLWYATQWSQCSSKCGSGIQTRKVYCGTFKGDIIKQVEDVKCDATKKYETRKNCTGIDVCEGDWFAGPWSACSKKCGGGTMTRKVLCFMENITVDATKCDPEKIIFSSESCNDHPCGKDEILPVGRNGTIDEESMDEDCKIEEGNNVVTIPINVGLNEHLKNVTVHVTSFTDDISTTEAITENTELASTVPDESTTNSLIGTTEDSRIKRAVNDGSISSESTETSYFSTSDSSTNSETSTDAFSTSDETSFSELSSSTDLSMFSTIASLSSGFTESTVTSVTEATGTETVPSTSPSSLKTSSESSDSTVSSTGIDISSSEIGTLDSETTAVSRENISTNSETTVVSTENTFSSSETGTFYSETSPSSSESIVTSQTTTVCLELSSTSKSSSPSRKNFSEVSSSSTSLYSTKPKEQRFSSSGRENPVTSAISIELTTKKCKVRKKPNCESSKFGCCIDGKTSATGPFSAGCPEISTCEQTTYGCCSDGVTSAVNKEGGDCPQISCNDTLFGCCPDGIAVATDNDYEGCPVESTTLAYNCKNSEYGCCPDGVSTATGPNFNGCYDCIEGSGDCTFCNETIFGCCPDGFTSSSGPNFAGCPEETTVTEDYTTYSTLESSTSSVPCAGTEFGCCEDNETTAIGPGGEGCVRVEVNCTETEFGCCADSFTPAKGKNYEGCRAPCESEPFGCCQDNRTAAHGANQEGCCLNSPFGCCPDNIVSATGPNFEGCGCQYSPYGCCPDNSTAARGYNNKGCGCEFSEFGCCPNKYTEAKGPNYEGCPCYTYQFGCCPDGVTRSKGPNFEGCSCQYTEFGCCGDGKTPAQNASRICSCEASKYGCCPDGVNEARGEDFEGCTNIPLKPGEACNQPKERGSCRDFTVKWFFDTDYGGCSRFWYGGCEGNANRFKTQDECKNTCVEPTGRDACFLPKIQGPCEGYYPSWYYDPKVKQCRQFIYGGCLGNNNKFQTYEECEQLCSLPDRLEPCEQSVNPGPCKGNFTRWYFDKKERSCQQFNYGGCKGNRNNFLTEMACQQQCLQPGKTRPSEVCRLPKDKGPCPGVFVRWFYNSNEKSCQEFVYGGCLGNLNRFENQKECAEQCHSKTTANNGSSEEECLLPRAPGTCSEKFARWFFDQSENRCVPFYYTGCGGNTNNFQTQNVCEKFCPARFVQQLCTLPAVTGECHNYTERWYFNSLDNQCRQFYYGGCGGNGNNFRTEAECQSRCVPGTKNLWVPVSSTVKSLEIRLTQSDVCRQEPDKGPCEQRIISWYYDVALGNCRVFEYGGCGGNQNRFENEEHCTRYCSFLRVNETHMVKPPLIDICETAKRDCESLRNCPYGVEEWVDADGCKRCGCFNPCRQHQCPIDEQCALDIDRTSEGNIKYKPICRLIRKPGSCPYLSDTQQCGVSCRTDADCSGNDKCCSHNCGNSCVAPLLITGLQSTLPPVTQTAPTELVPIRPFSEYSPQIESTDGESNVESEEGNYATLRCIVTGNPRPVVTWQKGGTFIDRSVGRYKLTEGVLQIVGLHKSDSGSYICSADNGVGVPAAKQFTLTVKDGIPKPAEIISDATPVVVVTLGAPTTLRCFAYGYPTPTVTWWKGDKMLPLQSEQYEQARDHSLAIKHVIIRALGPYTCQAYNGLERAASWTLTLHAVGPALPLGPEDLPFSIYLIPPPQSPPVIATLTPVTTLVTTSASTVVTVPVQTSILTNETFYEIGSNVTIPCAVIGYPEPQVAWYKDDEPIVTDERSSVSEKYELVIRDANPNDTGVYRCTAVNKFSSSSSSISITVQGPYIHPNCSDNPFFANCNLIVRAQYCVHEYYMRFCCRSCTLAGQLPLNFGGNNNNLESKTRSKRHARRGKDLVKFLSQKHLEKD